MTFRGEQSRPRSLLITGGTSGIGLEVATRALRTGNYNVAITGRNTAKLTDVRSRLHQSTGKDVLAIHSDASEWDSVQAATDETVAAFDGIDIAFANAGFFQGGTVPDGLPEHWRAMVLTNVLGPTLLAKAAWPHLKKSAAPGRFVMTGSITGFKNFRADVYSATKFAVNGFAENLRMQGALDGVGVSLIAPGVVSTDFYDRPHAPEQPSVPDVLDSRAIADAFFFITESAPNVDVNTVTVRSIGEPL